MLQEDGDKDNNELENENESIKNFKDSPNVQINDDDFF